MKFKYKTPRHSHLSLEVVQIMAEYVVQLPQKISDHKTAYFKVLIIEFDLRGKKILTSPYSRFSIKNRLVIWTQTSTANNPTGFDSYKQH